MKKTLFTILISAIRFATIGAHELKMVNTEDPGLPLPANGNTGLVQGTEIRGNYNDGSEMLFNGGSKLVHVGFDGKVDNGEATYKASFGIDSVPDVYTGGNGQMSAKNRNAFSYSIDVGSCTATINGKDYSGAHETDCNGCTSGYSYCSCCALTID